MWPTLFTSWGFRSVPTASLAIPAGTDQKKRNGVPAEEHQTQEDPRLDQEVELTRRHWGAPTAHVEGTEITFTLRVPIGKPARLSGNRHWIWNAGSFQQRPCVLGWLILGVAGFVMPNALMMGGRLKQVAFVLGWKTSLVISPSYIWSIMCCS